nr:hypothetical protein [Inconstantimicrobium porci]
MKNISFGPSDFLFSASRTSPIKQNIKAAIINIKYMAFLQFI